LATCKVDNLIVSQFLEREQLIVPFFYEYLLVVMDIRKINMETIQSMLGNGSELYKYVMELPQIYVDEVGLETILDFLSVEDGMNFRIQHGITQGPVADFSKGETERMPEESEIDYILRRNKVNFTWDQIKGRLIQYFIRRLVANIPREVTLSPEGAKKFLRIYGEKFLYEYLIPMSKNVNKKNQLSEGIRRIIKEEVSKVIENNINDNFWKWFGSSKVKSGNVPMVLYHGSNNSFDVFNVKTIRYVGSNGDGFYFSPDSHESMRYGDNVREFFLKIENPLSPNEKNLSTENFKAIIQYIWDNTEYREDLKNYGYFDDEQFQSFRDKLAEDLSQKDDYSALFDLTHTTTGSIKELAQIVEKSTEIKFDGVISPMFREYVAFYPNQIKSTNNDGTWDAGDDNIYS